MATHNDTVAKATDRRELLKRLSSGGLAAAGLGFAPQMLAYGARAVNTSTPSGAVNVRDYGATGKGIVDDIAAVTAALAAAHSAGAALYFPAGQYLLSSFPALAYGDVVFGDGPGLSTIKYAGAGVLISLTDKQLIHFRALDFWITGTQGQGFQLEHCFNCTFDEVIIRGNHVNSNYPKYLNTTGITLSGDTGGTMFINCMINNFGTGLVTSCIQNYVTNTKFATNHTSVLGTGNDHSAGLAISNCEFVSEAGTNTNSRHIYIDGKANNWWLSGVWFEKIDNAIVVGVAGVGGPMQFGMVNCKIAAGSICLDLQHCRQPYLANVTFDTDYPSPPPTALRINPATCPEGTAISLLSGNDLDIDPAVFPTYWTVIGRGAVSMPALDKPLAIGDSLTTGAPLLVFQDRQYNMLSQFLANGALLSNDAAAGIVLKSPDGHYWRLTVGDTGQLSTIDLGAGMPTA